MQDEDGYYLRCIDELKIYVMYTNPYSSHHCSLRAQGYHPSRLFELTPRLLRNEINDV